MNPAAASRRAKEKHPERYCPDPKCLWRVWTPCPKHMTVGQFRRICCFCKADMGPAGPGFSGDTHGVCEPPCPKAVEMGWGVE